MDVVVAGPVGQFQHHGAVGAVFGRVIHHVVQHAGGTVAVRVGGGRVHKALGIVGVVQLPVIDAAARDAVVEGVAVLEQQPRRVRTAEGEARDADLVALDIRQGLQPARPLDELPDRLCLEVPEDEVRAGAAVVAGGGDVRSHLDDAVAAVPLVRLGGLRPGFPDIGRVRAAVDLHHDGILLRRVETDRVGDGGGDTEAVRGLQLDQLRECIAGSVEIRAAQVGDLVGIARHAGGLEKPDLRRSRVVRQGRDEVLPVRRETDAGDIQGGIRQGRDPALAVDLVEGGADVRVAVRREIDVAGLLVDADEADAPVLPVRQAAEGLSVVGEEVDLLPARLEAAGHVEALVRKDDLLDPVEPGRIGLVVDVFLAAVGDADAVQVERILAARLTGDEELGAVRAPERDAEVLVLVLVEVRPDDAGRIPEVDDADADLRIRLARLRIAGQLQRAVLADRGVDREHRHAAVVEAVEADLLRIRRPPESPVAGRAAEDLLVIDPGRIAVQDQVGPVEGQARLRTGRDVRDPEVVVTREGQFRGVRGEGQVHGAVGLQRHLRELPGRLDAGTDRPARRGECKSARIRKGAVVAEGDLAAGNPFPGHGDPVPLLGPEARREQGCGQGREQHLSHTKNLSLKFTR